MVSPGSYKSNQQLRLQSKLVPSSRSAETQSAMGTISLRIATRLRVSRDSSPRSWSHFAQIDQERRAAIYKKEKSPSSVSNVWTLSRDGDVGSHRPMKFFVIPTAIEM